MTSLGLPAARAWCFVALAALALACHRPPPAPRALLEPAVDLRQFRRVAIVDFAASGPGAAPVARLVTRRFVESLQAGQPGVRILELGAQDRVLAAIGHRELDFEAIQAIGKRYGADAVFAGQLELSEVKPRLQLSQALESLGMKADVEATLTARLLEASGGATLWTRSSQGTEQVASVNLSRQGTSGATTRDPDQAYGRLAQTLAQRVSYDLGPRYAD